MWFQVHYPPLVGVLPIFRSRYFPLSVVSEYLALGDGPPRFRPRSTCAVLLGYLSERCAAVAYGTVTLYGSAFLTNSANVQRLTMKGPTTPHGKPYGLGCSLFARRYWGNRFFFLLLQLLRCFSSLRFFGNPGINARLTTSPGLSQPSTPILLTPRHPPHALSSLTTMILDSHS